MKKIFFLILSFSGFLSFSQKVTVSGIAKTDDNRGAVLIVLNDTLRKLPPDSPYTLSWSMWENKELMNYSDDDGAFSFSANLKDSLVFQSIYYISQSFGVADLYSQKTPINIQLKREPCVEYIACREAASESYTFIGQKIEVAFADEPRYCDVISMDSKYAAKYKILKQYSGDLKSDTIEFVSYDHASKVRYDEFQNVLLFVGKYCNDLIHKKYQYQPVYKTTNGQWATPVFEEYDAAKRKSEKQPRKVEMAEPITVSRYYSARKPEDIYKAPYFKIENGKVYMLFGYYPEDLLSD